MNSNNLCEYCGAEGKPRLSSDDLKYDVHVCDKCWKLLKNPVTALPLIRSHLTMELRGTMDSRKLGKLLNKYMEKISKWKPRE